MIGAWDVLAPPMAYLPNDLTLRAFAGGKYPS